MSFSEDERLLQMAVRSYVSSKYMAFDGKDNIIVDPKQLKEHEVYAIADPKRLIASDIFAALENIIDPKYNDGTIYNLLQHDGKYLLHIYEEADNDESVVVFVDSSHSQYGYDVRGAINVRQVYTVSQIDDSNVRFLVSDNIIYSDARATLIQRCYHQFFQEQFKAERYRDMKMKDYEIKEGLPASGYRIFVVDVKEISESQWYKDNLEAARLIKEYDLDVESYRYIRSMPDVFAAIRADAYDCVSEEEQMMLNREIYEQLRDFISEDDLPFLDEDMEKADSKDTESITDAVIAMALAGAESGEVFQKIHEVLGYSEYRINALTDEIYNANPDKGYILVTKDGDIQWYRDCYAIGEWEGAKRSPYFGKFQKNEHDTLLCFREFHPELFVKRLPSPQDFDEWETRYLESVAASRMEHPEMKYSKDKAGEDIVTGNWYYAGLKSKKCVNGISFHRTYGKHTFSPDECRKLLSGEELVIENFITKMDMETTIRGRLKDCADMYSEEMEIEFVRTDINVSKKRQMINAELGITEPGLPPMEQ